ncbi:alpha/beta-hydrolase [Heliocybe sulcata]|uniref:Alpha/beta-hydrolase n=1 Tax=Heliocybe sulcata TaxID=5364 RepID=A0A5C3N580_9AGAM|nr:alpha/beta-hydrolase [Heliocybe sulcata]
MPASSDVPSHTCLTLPYKGVDDRPVLVDLYIPSAHLKPADGGTRPRLASVVYFHGGGLTVGNRISWFPHWLQRRLNDAGLVFISADYRLIPPATGHDILEDIIDLFAFLSTGVNEILSRNPTDISTVQLNPDAIAVAGTSSGGLCAYLAAMHVSPKPKALLSFYGMGGDFLTAHYLTLKTKPFFRGREMLDPAPFARFLFPRTQAGSPPSDAEEGQIMISDSPLAYHPPTSPTPGYPANPRMQLTRLYLQLGVFLDYYTGCHSPSLSLQMRDILASTATDGADVSNRMKDLIPDEHLCLFPQLCSSLSDWPSTFLVHGTSDTAVKFDESTHLHRILQEAGVDVTIKVVDGQEHSFDYQKDAEEKFGATLFDEAVEFLVRRLTA